MQMSDHHFALAANPLLTDDARWQAMIARDARYDGSFVCAVKTTGIYCRPSCPAVKPKRQNVSFYMLAEAAEAAGFRPCKRCRPHMLTASGPQAQLAHQVCQFIREHAGLPSLKIISEAVHVSPFHLQRVFKRVMGITPREYADMLRVDAFKRLLRDGKTVTDALYEAGYGSSSRLYEQAHQQLGMTPTSYRKKGHGMTIAYTIRPCALGLALIGVTEHGICAVYLSDDETVLLQSLRDEFSAAQITAGTDPALEHWVEQALEEVNGSAQHPDLPIDVQASAFQRRVWQALRAIPKGQTRTYQQVAVAVGDANATRAVAQACARNRVAVLIPCHRVVRSDGGLADYRWGVDRKAALLAREHPAKP
jgi:AraC family transcriptional regulator of adaptative response/methylated-DNA-[protein]-cysteine methyltransferase